MGYKGWEDFTPGSKAKAAERQWQGRVNRRNGETLEQYILEACEIYREQKRADINKTPEPFKVLSGMKRLSCGAMGFEGVFAKKAEPDFKGVLTGGRAVVFEAKSTATDRIAQDVVSDAQWRCLESYSAMGADAFVVVSINLIAFYRVPWDVWTTMKARFGHKYMNQSNLSPYEIKIKNGYLNFL